MGMGLRKFIFSIDEHAEISSLLSKMANGVCQIKLEPLYYLCHATNRVIALFFFEAGRKVRTAESNTPVNGRSRYRGDLYHSGDGKESATENYRPVLILSGMR
ncbi:hypothetical protein BH20BAC1_BH20BAC1_04650 [soil metagenome]